MNSTTTGIAVALALVVVAIFFITPGLSPFASRQQAQPAAQTVTTTDASGTSIAATTTTTSAPTMTTSDGLQITDEVIGTGAVATPGQTVTVAYVGMLENGTVFDASANHGGSFSFPLGAGQVIKGWDEGVAGMKVGGKRRLVIPAALAYGNRAVGNVIPANSTLIFEVELLSVGAAK